MRIFAVVVPSVRSWFTRSALVLLALLAALPTAQAGPDTALRDYVNAADPAYGYTHVATVPQTGFSIHVLAMTSQNWRSASEVNRTLWSHWLALIVPTNIRTTTGAVLVVGGDNSPTPPSLNGIEVLIAAQLAMSSSSVVAIVANTPNQPLVFADTPFPQDEDALVAYTWDKAMDTGDWTWPAYLPMVKGVVRAMDTAQSYAPTVTGRPLQNFVVIGFSKRGATTWLTAAVDPRVVAAAPGVFDVLNMAPQFEHHYSAYGFYTSAVQDYVNYNIVRRIRSPEGQDLLKVVDPHSYRTALGLPKFLINSPGDQFFLPDAERFYLNNLPGETLSRYVPNTDHSLSSSAGVIDALTSLIAWYQQVIFGAPRPVLTTTLAGGVLTVRANSPATVARLWKAVNPAARDFRRESIGEAWTNSPVPDSGGGTYIATLSSPASGYAAYFLELVYPNVAGLPQTYSTPVYVTPDTLPFEVVDAIGEPRGKGYWKQQVNIALGAPGRADFDPVVLAGYFPIPLFDGYVNDIAAADAVFAAKGGKTNEARAQCLATRLNIASNALGWYSRLALDRHGTRPLWEYFQQAHAAFLGGQPERAKDLCEEINSVDAGGRPDEWRHAAGH
jgi:PhoPQ-activated pathogenicity-related protein